MGNGIDFLGNGKKREQEEKEGLLKKYFPNPSSQAGNGIGHVLNMNSSDDVSKNPNSSADAMLMARGEDAGSIGDAANAGVQKKPERGEVKDLPPGASGAFARALGIKWPREWTVTQIAIGGLTWYYLNHVKGEKTIVGYIDATGKFVRDLPERRTEQVMESIKNGNPEPD